MPAIKYQQKIHKAFVEECLGDNSKEEYEKAIAAFPALEGKVTELDFADKDAAAILTGNVFLCQHFAIKSEESSSLEFESEHLYTVRQTVKFNADYYKHLLTFFKEEKEEPYQKIYKNIQRQLDEYFSLTAERILEDVYGTKYTDFVAKFTEDEETRQQERVATRKKNAEEKAAQEQAEEETKEE